MNSSHSGSLLLRIVHACSIISFFHSLSFISQYFTLANLLFVHISSSLDNTLATCSSFLIPSQHPLSSFYPYDILPQQCDLCFALPFPCSLSVVLSLFTLSLVGLSSYIILLQFLCPPFFISTRPSPYLQIACIFSPTFVINHPFVIFLVLFSTLVISLIPLPLRHLLRPLPLPSLPLPFRPCDTQRVSGS